MSTDDKIETIYHYCSVSAFHGILSTKQLWLSNSLFSNDYKEQKLLLEKVERRFTSLMDAPNGSVFQPLAHVIDKKRPTPYVCCFSQEQDLLSQWRGYADDAKGFAIGFSYDRLEEYVRNQRAPEGVLRLWDVTYDDDHQMSLVNDRLQCYVKGIEEHDSKATIKAAIGIWGISAASKHPCFREERESRILMLLMSDAEWTLEGAPNPPNNLQMQFRTARDQIIPYFIMPFPTDLVTDIVIGPKNPAVKNREALELFLQAHGYKCDITKSKATYC